MPVIRTSEKMMGPDNQCCALLFAAVESAHAGRPVDVQEFLRTNMQAVEHT